MPNKREPFVVSTRHELFYDSAGPIVVVVRHSRESGRWAIYEDKSEVSPRAGIGVTYDEYVPMDQDKALELGRAYLDKIQTSVNARNEASDLLRSIRKSEDEA